MVNRESKWYDITLSGEYDHKKIIEMLKTIGKTWAFQKERGEQTGYEHFQCRVELKERAGMQDMISRLGGWGFLKGHISRSHTRDYDYTTKEGTRIDGPWRYDDIEIPKWLGNEKPEWYPWQRDVIKINPEERKVHVIIDFRGNTGKSYLANWLAVRGKACKIPIVGNYKDAMRTIYDRPNSPRYFLDLPRAENLTSGMISAIENLKDGHVFDDRYKYVERWMEPPAVIIFCNQAPRKNLLSADRWNTYIIDEALTLNRV